MVDGKPCNLSWAVAVVDGIVYSIGVAVLLIAVVAGFPCCCLVDYLPGCLWLMLHHEH